MIQDKRYKQFIFCFVLFQVDPANIPTIEGLKSRLEQKDKEICALKLSTAK